MNNIEVEKIIEPVAASDGAGVKLKRSIGTHLIDYHDPFLMLDEFGSENKDDYIGGFPPHPHRGIETVTLKKGCRVLLIKNLDVANGLVNGSIGTVEDLFTEGVRVKFDNGFTQMINRVEWEIELDGSKVVVQQIPLMLSYSITIHKSQSLSLDNAVLDLADCFCNHMVYVALSRVRSLSGLYLRTFDPKKITVNSKLLEFIDKVEGHEKH